MAQSSSGDVRVQPLAGSLTLSGTLSAVKTSYPKALLLIAKDLIDQGHFNIAIITSHMACEVAAERALDAAYAARDLVQLGEAVDDLMNGHNLGNDRHRKVYNALTGSQIETQPFWAQFKAASQKRNSIIHGSAQATKVEAENALQAATELIMHLKQM